MSVGYDGLRMGGYGVAKKACCVREAEISDHLMDVLQKTFSLQKR